MKQENLPQRWQDKIQAYLKITGSKYPEFSIYDFHNDLKITFENKSYAFFYSAFYWIDNDSKEVAVFTEHYGYHIFYLSEILLETVDYYGNVIKTDDYRTE